MEKCCKVEDDAAETKAENRRYIEREKRAYAYAYAYESLSLFFCALKEAKRDESGKESFAYL